MLWNLPELEVRALRLSLKAHPLALLRPRLGGLLTAAQLASPPLGGRRPGRVSVAGLVLVRQRPGTAGGVIFITLEDETGVANIIVWPPLFERYRPAILTGRLLQVDGRLQRQDRVIHVIAERVGDLSPLLGSLTVGSRDFH